MKILVTGGAGFIGSHVVDAYIAQGHSVTVIDNLSTGYREFLNPKARFYQIDITDRLAVREVFARERFDLVNHHAAQVDVRVSVAHPLADAHTNIMGLLTLLEACREFSVKRFILISSGGVIYGEPTRLPIPEDAPKQPISPYGIAKLTSELYLFSAKQTWGLCYVALRYANVYGPRQTPKSEATVISTFARALARDETVTIFGDGQQTRDFVFVSDVVTANLLATQRLDELNRAPARSIDDLAFNVGTGKEISINELLQQFSHVLQRRCTAHYVAPRPGELRRNALDISKAQRILGFTPKISLAEGLHETIAWVRSNSLAV
ncbi:MAG: NAD-dependent epimerase/dehydratase family protein [Candidatus Bipolaricaulota bacterium]|nr:NAD-dependent epimerase/dehydratase family protein [Candidatus Bipolaricaulota bacterium]